MKGFLQRFWTAAVSVAGIVGLYLGAATVKLTSWFWAVLLLAVVVGVVPNVLHWSVDITRRLQAYPRLIERVGVAEIEQERLKQELTSAQSLASQRWDLGVQEGRSQILGSILSQSTPPPKVVAVAEEEGSVAFVGRYRKGTQPSEGARYQVVSATTGERKGTVEVARIDDDKDYAILRCVDPFAVRFWQHLADRVQFDSSGPPDIELAPYAVGPTGQVVQIASRSVLELATVVSTEATSE